MSKLINLINLDEIKTLRITCGECDEYWSLPVSSGKDKLQKKCNCSGPSIREHDLGYIKGLLENIDSLQKFLENFKISIELETEVENPLT